MYVMCMQLNEREERHIVRKKRGRVEKWVWGGERGGREGGVSSWLWERKRSAQTVNELRGEFWKKQGKNSSKKSVFFCFQMSNIAVNKVKVESV